jgi:hypothetical protein
MIKPAFLVATLLVLAACSPADLVDAATTRAALAVVLPVVEQELPAPTAEIAAGCILSAASSSDLRALAADVGVRPGTRTMANIRNLANRPAAAACLNRSALPKLKLGA